MSFMVKIHKISKTYFVKEDQSWSSLVALQESSAQLFTCIHSAMSPASPQAIPNEFWLTQQFCCFHHSYRTNKTCNKLAVHINHMPVEAMCDAHKSTIYYRVGQKTGLFFRLDNFVTVSRRKACSMSKFSKFYPEKGTKLVFQWVLIFFAKFAQIITNAELCYIWPEHINFTQFTLTYSETTVIFPQS